jgi:hypothetical protein
VLTIKGSTITLDGEIGWDQYSGCEIFSEVAVFAQSCCDTPDMAIDPWLLEYKPNPVIFAHLADYCDTLQDE